MSELKFTEEIKEILQIRMPEYIITTHENLIYKVIIDENIEYKPKDPEILRRGNLAFQTDLMIKREKIPLVVIEVKYKKLSTHDIIIYSANAQRHKQVYLYIRYGLLVGNYKVIYNRFFTHNEGFDFALAFESVDEENINTLIRVISDQIKNAEKLLSILKKGNNIKIFNTTIKIEYV